MFLVFLLLIVVCRSTPIPLGNVTHNQKLSSCPTNLGLYSGMQCANITVECVNTDNIAVIIGVLLPNTTAAGTILLVAGGGGTNSYNSGFVPIYAAANFTVVQVVFESDWNILGYGLNNLKTAACRPATVYHYLYGQIHTGGTTKPYAICGTSGGAASIAYSIAWYGADSYLDYGQMLNGPNFSNISEGCIYPAGPNITVCPNNGQQYCNQTSEGFSTNTSFASTFGDCSVTINDIVGYNCSCPTQIYNSTVINWFNSQSIVFTGAQLHYNYTGISSWLCKPQDNISVGMAQYFAQSVSATNGFHQWLITNCTGAEGIVSGYYLPTGQSGLTVISNDMLANAVPRH